MRVQIQAIQNYYVLSFSKNLVIEQSRIRDLLISYLNKEIQSQKIKAITPDFIKHNKSFIISNLQSPRNQIFFLFAKLIRLTEILPEMLVPYQEKYLHSITAVSRKSVQYEYRAYQKNNPEESEPDKFNQIETLKIDIFLKETKLRELESKIKFNKLFAHKSKS